MTRVQLARTLDRGVAERRIVALTGLPRAGRSQFLKSWAATRTLAVDQGSPSLEGAPLVAIDHFGMSAVPELMARFRADEAAARDCRYIVAPTDFATLRALRASLAGSTEQIEVPPLSLQDYIASRTPHAAPHGPGASAEKAMAEPTNLPPPNLDAHWLYGGLPESLYAESAEASLRFRNGILDDLLIRDYREFNVTPASRLPEVLRYLANQNGAEFDIASCALLKAPELRSVIYLFEHLGLVRRLPNFPAGSSASMGKRPRYFIRDSGLLHALLGIATIAELRTHAAIGGSWEGYAVESLIAAAGPSASAQFYRARRGNDVDEIDLVLSFAGSGATLAIECKVSASARPEAGFSRACGIVKATDQFLVHSDAVSRSTGSIPRLTLSDAIRRVAEAAKAR